MAICCHKMRELWASTRTNSQDFATLEWHTILAPQKETFRFQPSEGFTTKMKNHTPREKRWRGLPLCHRPAVGQPPAHPFITLLWAILACMLLKSFEMPPLTTCFGGNLLMVRTPRLHGGSSSDMPNSGRVGYMFRREKPRAPATMAAAMTCHRVHEKPSAEA